MTRRLALAFALCVALSGCVAVAGGIAGTVVGNWISALVEVKPVAKVKIQP